MFTPQEIQEQTFSKAVFGGYDMQQVDDFLEPLTEDYIMLYKENSVLKSKMKVLVEKLEEYRGQEAAMKQQMAQAQAQCDRMIAEAQSRSATIVAGAETTLRSQSDDLKKELAEEQTRLDSRRLCAKSRMTGRQTSRARPFSRSFRKRLPSLLRPQSPCRPRARSRLPRRFPRTWKSSSAQTPSRKRRPSLFPGRSRTRIRCAWTARRSSSPTYNSARTTTPRTGNYKNTEQ